MHKPVVVVKRVLEINKIYRGLETGPWGESEPDQCFRVIALSTEQGWIDYLVSIQGEKERSWLEMLATIDGPWNYYEIQTD